MSGNRKHGFRRGNRGGFSQSWYCSGCQKVHPVSIWIEYEYGANKFCGRSLNMGDAERMEWLRTHNANTGKPL